MSIAGETRVPSAMVHLEGDLLRCDAHLQQIPPRLTYTDRPTPSQGAVIALLRENGNMAVVCYGCAEAIRAIEAYLGLNATSAGVNTCHDSAAC